MTDCIFRQIRTLFKNFTSISQKVKGLYQLAQGCCNLQEPTLKTNQTFAQTSPPPDEFLYVEKNRPSLVQQPEEPSSTTTQNPQNSPVSQQDRAFTEFEYQQKTCETFAHQEITFLQPSEIYTSSEEQQEESTLSELNTV